VLGLSTYPFDTFVTTVSVE